MLHFLIFLLIACSRVVFAEELPKPIPLQIPMRDGKNLAADLYLPAPDAKGLPCILIRSPAGRETPYALMHLKLLKEGYAIVIQEARNIDDKEGRTLPYLDDGWGERQDGYDTVAYLAKSPYTNGKIGTIGASALGITQLMMAPTNPPGLAAQYISFATSDLYHHGLYPGGELMKHQVENWLKLYARHPDVYKTVYSQPHYNDFWTQFNMLQHSAKCCQPALHVGGWYDVFLKGTLEAYVKLQNEGGKGAKDQQKLVVGPWVHLWPLAGSFGSYDYPKNSERPPHDTSPEKWFSAHLKGNKEALKDIPAVQYFVMGPVDGTPTSGNTWKSAETWPVPHQLASFYLTSDNKLAPKESATAHSFQYAYDPNQPIPTLGGRNLFLPSGPIDQRPIEARQDLLVFTTEPLENELLITGDLTARLFVDSDREDTAFSVRLTDVYPDGKSLIIADGMARLSVAKKESLARTPPYEIKIDLWPTSMAFAKGHRLRVLVSSSNYPRYEKNLNSLKRPYETEEAHIAQNTLFVGPKTPSQLILPVIPAAKTP